MIKFSDLKTEDRFDIEDIFNAALRSAKTDDDWVRQDREIKFDYGLAGSRYFRELRKKKS